MTTRHAGMLIVSSVLALAGCKRGVSTQPNAAAISPVEQYRRRAITSEAVEKLASLYRLAAVYAMGERISPTGAPIPPSFPPSAPRTPAQVPGVHPVTDGPETWSHPTWQALSFSISDPHYYSYEFISDGHSFTARAYGDLDGDGVLSTFERTATLTADGEMQGSPGVRIVNELE